MKNLDLDLCPISTEQLQETFIKIIEQLTELQFDYKDEFFNEIKFVFKTTKSKIPTKTLQILYDLDCDYCEVILDIPCVYINVTVNKMFGNSNLYLYQVIGDLLFDYISALKNNRYNETNEDKFLEFLDKFGKFVFKEEKGDLHEIKNMSPEKVKYYIEKFEKEEKEDEI